MSTFRYHTKDERGQPQNGTIEALSEKDAAKKLQEQGLIVISLEIIQGVGDKLGERHIQPSSEQTVSSTEQKDVKNFTEAKINHVGIVKKTGLIIWGIFLIIGAISLCFTIIGIILAIFVFMGASVIFASAKDTLKGICPYCGQSVQTGLDSVGADCPACKKRIVVRDNKFFKVD